MAVTLGDLWRRAGDRANATRHYREALALVENTSERRFIERRLERVGRPEGTSSRSLGSSSG